MNVDSNLKGGDEFICDYCIIGAGPAGLAAAYELSKKGITNIIVIDKNEVVGGLARTIVRDHHRFDVGPHRLFTKNAEIQTYWQNILGEDLLRVQRKTRIYFRNKYFSYPLRLLNVIGNIGILDSCRALFSFINAQFREREKTTFEAYIIQSFGKRLYEMFFKSYTEKVWGIPCNKIDAKWAAQRIKGLTFFSLLANIIGLKKRTPKTLEEEFYYPKYGSGQLYERIAQQVASKGARILLKMEVVQVNLLDECSIEKIIFRDLTGKHYGCKAKYFFTSAPLTRFVDLINHPKFVALRKVTSELFYRNHITINLLVDQQNIFPDQWIYIHGGNFKMARLANYNNFSSEMTSDRLTTSITVEYFASEGDSLWSSTNVELVALASRELTESGIINGTKILDSFVVRETDAYPAYYLGYETNYNIIKQSLKFISNLFPIGRGGLFKYNNQDHAQLSGFYAVRNLLENAGYDLWAFNSDSNYFEEKISRKEQQ